MDSFVGSLSENFEADPEQNVFVGIWKEYEKVIVQSLITSFCLDFFPNSPVNFLIIFPIQDIILH